MKRMLLFYTLISFFALTISINFTLNEKVVAQNTTIYKSKIIFDSAGNAYLRCRFGSTGCEIENQCPIGDPNCNGLLIA